MQKQKMQEDLGDFEEILDESRASEEPTEESGRYRKPRNNEKIGIIIQRLGGNRMTVKSTDGKARNCRVPGRYKRTLWLRPKNIVLIVPWEDDDSKGDIVYKYSPSAVNQMKKQGLIDNLEEEF